MGAIGAVYSGGALESVAAQWFVIGFVCCLLPALAATIPALLYLRRRLRGNEGSEVADVNPILDPSPKSSKGGTLNRGFSGPKKGESKAAGTTATASKAEDNVYSGLDDKAAGDDGSIYENNENIYDRPDTGSTCGGNEAYVELQIMK